MLGQPYDAKVDLWSVGIILYGKCMIRVDICIVLLTLTVHNASH